MAVIRLSEFKGELPSWNPQLLSPQHALKAYNLHLLYGQLEPTRTPLDLRSLNVPVPATIFRYTDQAWLEFADEVDVARSVAANDTFERVYWTDGVYPKVTDNTIAAVGSPPYPNQSHRLGLPAPSFAPNAVVSGPGSGTAESRFYVVTYVGKYGEEGPPSPVTAEVEVLPGQTVTLNPLPLGPNAPYVATKLRIYRTNTVGTEAVFQYVDEVTLPTGSYADTKPSSELGEALQSETWDAPPDDMVGLVTLPNGVLGAFRNNELLFSEQGLPHAWPVDYRRSVDYNVVGLGVMGSEVFVGTEGTCYVVSGNDPAAYAVTPLPIPYSCVSKRSIVSIGDMVVYASEEGLVSVGRSGATLLTEQMFNRDDWATYTPSTLKAWRWGRFYLAAYIRSNTTALFAIDPLRPEDGVIFFDGIGVASGYTDVKEERVYMATADRLVRWDGGVARQYDWCSRPFSLAAPEPMNAVRVLAEAYPVTVRVYRDGTEQAHVVVNNHRPRRIPGGRLGREYVVQVSADTSVRDVVVASSMDEIKRA
jgi:hypothetical protein